MKLKFNVSDKGFMYEVVSVNQNETDFDSCPTYEIFSWEVYETVAEAIMSGKKVNFPKDLNRELDVTDLIIEEVDELEEAKRVHLLKIKDFVYNKKINKVSIINIYTFVALTAWFNDMGVFITDENRAEQYAKIIEKASSMDDIKANLMIDNLEALLVAKDELAEVTTAYTEMRKNIEKIDMASSVEEVETIYSSLISDYYND